MSKTQTQIKDRLESLDTLRGFDMLLIMGFTPLVISLCALFPDCGTAAWISNQMTHVAWNGFHQHDTIFPLFIFIAGITFPFSLYKQQKDGLPRSKTYKKILRRSLLLVFLGLVCNGLFNFQFNELRCASVLARIGLAWGLAAVIYLNTDTRIRTAVCAATLLGYWALSALVGAPDAPQGAGPLSQDGCLAGYIDRLLLPGRLYNGNFDPEGWLSTIPSVITALLGMMTGDFIRRKDLSPSRKAVYLLLAAVVFGAAAWLWSTVYPINKKLWSSSFVCAAASYSLALFAVFYYIIDVKGWKRWTLFFRVIGLNSITIFVAQRFIDFRKMGKFFFGGLASFCPEEWAAIVLQASFVLACWAFLYFLYRKQIFFKI